MSCNARSAESPERLIIADGLMWGNIPVPALAGLGIAQSGRGYQPMQVTHWKADWIKGADTWPRPQWPLAITPGMLESDRRQTQRLKAVFHENPIFMAHASEADPALPWGRERYRRQLVAPWQALQGMGVGVHIGEFGAHNQTPHDVVLAWMGDLLACLKEAGLGWALWNLSGSFGVLDSGRGDVGTSGCTSTSCSGGQYCKAGSCSACTLADLADAAGKNGLSRVGNVTVGERAMSSPEDIRSIRSPAGPRCTSRRCGVG